jgi:hypothetical protein
LQLVTLFAAPRLSFGVFVMAVMRPKQLINGLRPPLMRRVPLVPDVRAPRKGSLK